MKTINLLNPPEVILRSNWVDRYETKVSRWLTTWDGAELVDIGFIGVPLSKTSISVSGASMLPNAMRELFKTVTTYNVDADVDLQELLARDMGDIQMHVTDLFRCHENIEQGMKNVYAAFPQLFPILVGGDHSITYPSVKAFKQRFSGKVGIVQFDAHMDVRNLEDGGPSNGTPIRSLLESETIEGRHIAQIGIHSFANSKPYREYARSKDMDVLDQAYAPGVPAMAPAGMTSWQLLDALFLLGQNPKVKGLDVVCVDPVRDQRQSTIRTALYGILTFLAGYSKR